MNSQHKNSNNNEKVEKVEKNETANKKEILCPLKVAKWANENGLVGKDQVENMEKIVNGTIDYATTRSLCG